MPRSTVDRSRQGVEEHLAAAVEYIKIAEASDAERSAYEHAADEIIAAMNEESSLSFAEVARRIGRDRKYWHALVGWRRSGVVDHGPFSEAAGKPNRDVSGAKKIARERPEDFAAAFEQAPAAAKKKIAEQISRSPEVRAAARQHDADVERKRKPETVKRRTDHTLFEFESKIVGARRYLRDALALVDSIDQPGDDEDILELLEMVVQLAEANREAFRTGKSLDTWAWELYERSAD